MFLASRFSMACGLLLLLGLNADAREWTDKTGSYKFYGSLIAFDDHQVVLKLDEGQRIQGHELLAIERKDLSQEDLEYLASKEAIDTVQSLEGTQTWTMKNGSKVVARVVDFGRKQVTIQSRRSKIYVNDKAFANLPEIYQQIIPRIVENFEGVAFETSKDFERWVRSLNGKPRTYQCEGVLMEMENGDEYGIPFFLFSDQDLKVLQPGWEQWLAAEEDQERQRRHALYLQSLASNYQQNLAKQIELQNQIGIAQLQMLAVASGAVDLWEVYLQPGARGMGYPIAVVVAASNSQLAAQEALSRNPGYVVGPIRRLSRRF